MTALTQYARLECPGIWRPEPGAQRRDVVVNFGDASLVISTQTGRALSHWSLAAVARVNPGELPALFTPSAEATELLEVADDTMVEAIETVRRAVLRARPRGGRLRVISLAASLALALGAAFFWVPDALVRHAMAVLPPASHAELGAQMLASAQRVTRAPCRAPRADRALASLAARLAPAAPEMIGRIVVLPEGPAQPMALPGGTILAGRALVEDYETPEVLAGYVLAEAVRAAGDPPVADLLRSAGPAASARLLTTGHLPDAVLAQSVETQLTSPRDPPPHDALLAAFAEAGVASTPYAYARDVTGESVLPLIEADPARGRPEPPPLLNDGDWVALQAICDG